MSVWEGISEQNVMGDLSEVRVGWEGRGGDLIVRGKNLNFYPIHVITYQWVRRVYSITNIIQYLAIASRKECIN